MSDVNDRERPPLGIRVFHALAKEPAGADDDRRGAPARKAIAAGVTCTIAVAISAGMASSPGTGMCRRVTTDCTRPVSSNALSMSARYWSSSAAGRGP